ncbi:long-chain fatty acid--CoA ligase [Rhodococcus sp. 14C212]|uniref:class I adenylate-forming enzyme family protein n=1 Tax=Rhodococcus sp. 14C212 TaxID=2711209 RepID=UPI0013EDC494|nr:AMP-binding protein [Rhodococcus sp. 14C212]NGP05694.1 long-chain fatty acid--CoA ligase [Rhodococcus sp. 14C212]
MDLAHLLYRSALRYPDNPLWISLDRPPVTYAEGAARVSSLANAILARTSQRARVAILSTNRHEGLEGFLATITAGCAAVTLNPRGHQEDYRHALSDSGATIVLCDAALADRLTPLREDLTHIEHWVSFGGDIPDFDSFDDWLQSPRERPDIAIEPDDPAWLFYTSGTTGKPKGAVETHRNLLAMTRHFMLELGSDLGSDDVMLHLAPISHGSCSVAMPHLAVGAANAFPTSLSFDPSAVLETIDRLNVTATMLAPTMIRMLLDAPDVEKHDLASLKTVVYGAAPMPVADLKRALEVFGPVFVQFYGQAEAAATITCLPKAEHRLDDEDCIRRLGSAGRETFSTRVRIVDPQGQEAPVGTVGEITVRGELVMAGYWERPDATADTIKDGWLHTGDAGYLDDAGYLFITDRIKDMIISGGSNIYAREVEEILGQHPDIAQSAVIGIPDEKWGEVVAAVVVPHKGTDLTPESVIDFARKSMASYKKPHHVWIVDELPTNAYGKVLKRELRKQYQTAVG